MPNAVKITSADNRPGVAWVLLDLSGSNVDLTDPEGQTGGYCARQLYVTTAGVVKFDGMTGGLGGFEPDSAEVTVPDNFYVNAFVTTVYSTANGTTAGNVYAIL